MNRAHRPLPVIAVLAAFVAALFPARPATASFDEFADHVSPRHFALRAGALTLAIKGELEVELHDLEGEGGPGYDSPTDTRTIGTRSPFVEIDSFWLALRLGIGESLGVFSVIEFTTRAARVGAVWVDFRATAPGWLDHHLELGYNTPIVAIDRRTERYPLLGTIYWREPELHLAYTADFALGAHVHLTAAASLAMMRPLDFAGVQESTSQRGTINVLAYGAAAPFSGNGPVGGGRLRLTVYGAFLEGFGFGGRLAAEGGTDVLRSGFPSYRDLDGYDTATAHGGPFFWAGGRVGYDGHGAHAVVEAAVSREDLLLRWGLYAQASYQIELLREHDWLASVEPVVRYEIVRIVDAAKVQASGRALRSTAVINAVSWDWDILTLGVIVEIYRNILRLRCEYAFVWETNGVPDLGVATAPFRNDELLVHLEVRF